MSDEAREEKAPEAPESVPAEAAPAAAAAALDRESFAEQLAADSGLSAKAATDWLRKLMPAKKVDGVQLDGMSRLDPSRKKDYENFLQKDSFAASRERLASRIAVWIDVLKQSEDSSEASESLEENINSLTSLFEGNQKKALEAVRPLEMTYRQLDAFYANGEAEPGDELDAWIYNATPSRLMDPDDRDNFDTLAERIQEAFRSFSMRKNYGLLVMPGWLEDIQQIDRLAELANQNKLTAITDGPDHDSAKQLLEFMQDDAFASMLGNDPHKRNIALYCNYLLARTKNKVEEEELYVPPACFVAGAITRGDNTDGIHQSRAGFKHGKLKNAVSARFKVDRPKATKLMKSHGLNAVVDWDGYPTIVGDQNLSTEEGRNAYSLIRTEDWIVKNMLNFLNYQAFQAINAKNLQTWKTAMYKFLDGICDRYGNNIIQGFDVKVTSSDEDRRKNQVNVMLLVKYQHMVRYFNLRVRDKDGRKEADTADSDAE